MNAHILAPFLQLPAPCARAPPCHPLHVQVTFVLSCLLLVFVAATYVFTRSRPVYLLNFYCLKPPAK